MVDSLYSTYKMRLICVDESTAQLEIMSPLGWLSFWPTTESMKNGPVKTQFICYPIEALIDVATLKERFI